MSVSFIKVEDFSGDDNNAIGMNNISHFHTPISATNNTCGDLRTGDGSTENDAKSDLHNVIATALCENSLAHKCDLCTFKHADHSEVVRHFQADHCNGPKMLPDDDVCRRSEIKKVYRCEDCNFVTPFHRRLVIHQTQRCRLSLKTNAAVKEPVAAEAAVMSSSMQPRVCTRAAAERAAARQLHLNVNNDACVVDDVERRSHDFRCPYCKLSFNKRLSMRRHVEFVHGVSVYPWRCPLCSLAYVSRLRLVAHVQAKHGECSSEVLQSLKSATSLGYDLLGPERSESCSDKTPVVATAVRGISEGRLQRTAAYRIRRHYSLKTAARKFRCRQCTFVTSHLSSFRRHKKTIHGEVRVLECELCEYRCHARYLMDKHLKDHCSDNDATRCFELSNQQAAAGAENRTCRVSSRCNATSHFKRSLSGGVPTQSKRKRVDSTRQMTVASEMAARQHSVDGVASFDGKSVDMNGNSLKVETMNGDGVNSVRSAAKQTAIRRASKKVHGAGEESRISEGEGNELFRCGICSLALDSAGALRLHASTVHSADRRFKCKLCGKRCNFKWNLRKHVRGVHKIPDSDRYCIDLSICTAEGAKKLGSESRTLDEQFKKPSAKSPDPKVAFKSPAKDIVNFSKSESRASSTKQYSIESMFLRNRKDEWSMSKDSADGSKDTVGEASSSSPSGSEKSASLRAVSGDGTALNGVTVTCVTSSDVSRNGCISDTPRKGIQLAEGRRRPKNPISAKDSNGLLSEVSSMNGDGRVVKCSKCPRMFTNRKTMYQHMTVHNDLRRYQCTVCGLRSNGGGNMRRHIRNVHSSKASFVCLSRAIAAESIVSYKQLVTQRRSAPAPRIGKLSLAAGRVVGAQVNYRSSDVAASESEVAASQNCSVTSNDDACRSTSSQSAAGESVQLLKRNVVSCAPSQKCSRRGGSSGVALKGGKLVSSKKRSSIWKCRLCDFSSRWQWSWIRHMKRCKRRAAHVGLLADQRAVDVSDQKSPELTVGSDSNSDANDKRQPKKIESYFRKPAVLCWGLGAYKCSHCRFRTNHASSYRRHLSVCDPVSHSARPATSEAVRMLASGENTSKYGTRSRNRHSYETGDSHVAGLVSSRDSSNLSQREATGEGRASGERKQRSQSVSCMNLYKCSCCSFKSKWRSVIRRHLSHCNPAARLVDLSASDTKSHFLFKCSLCNFGTNWSSGLSRHRKTLHPTAANIVADKDVEISPAKLNSASRESREDAQHKIHERSKDRVGSEDVLKLWRFTCTLCNYRSNYRGNVLKHQTARHSGQDAAIGFLREEEARMTLDNYIAFLSPKRRMMAITSPLRRASSGAIRTAQRSVAVGSVKRGTGVMSSSDWQQHVKLGRVGLASADSIAESENEMKLFREVDENARELSNCESARVGRLRSPKKTDAKLRCDETLERPRETSVASSPFGRTSTSNVLREQKTVGLSSITTKKKSYLKQRMDAMLNVQRYKCSACDFHSSWQSVVYKHRKRLHQNAHVVRLGDTDARRISGNAAADASAVRKFQCHSCSYRAFSRLGLERHVNVAHKTAVSRETNGGQSCGKLTKSKMQERLDAEADLRRFKCSTCGYRTNWAADAYKHRKRVHDMTSTIIQMSIEEANATRGSWTTRKRCEIKCTSCSYRSRSCMDMNRHRNQMHRLTSERNGVAQDGTKPWQSQQVRTDSSRNLRVFTCSLCSFRTKHRSNFYTHRKRFHTMAQLVHLKPHEVKTAECGREYGGKSAASCSASALECEFVTGGRISSNMTSIDNDDEEMAVPSKDQSSTAKVQSKESSKDSRNLLRRFACPFCFLRSNHRQVIHRHMKRKHPGKVGVVKVLSNMTGEGTLTDFVRQRCGAPSAECTALEDRDVGSTALVAVMPSNNDCASPKRRSPAKAGRSGDSCVGPDSRHVVCSQTAAKAEMFDDSSSLPTTRRPARGVWLLCNECPFISRYRSNLTQHRLLHRPRAEMQVSCDLCSFTADRSSLTKHSIVHRPTYAEIRAMGRWSSVPAKLAMHSTSAVVYSCSSCPFVSRYPHTMTVHRHNHRPREEASHKCGRCSFWSCDRSTVAKHAHVHRRGYAERRISSLYSSPTKSAQAPPPLPPLPPAPVEAIDFGLDVDDEVIEMATIKHRLVASRVSVIKGPSNSELASSSFGLPNDSVVRTLGTNAAGATDAVASRSAASPASRRSSIVVAGADVGCGNVEKKLRSWRCDKCPYSVREVERFKCHVSLHGRRLTYQCNYCNYSVLSYWRLAEHRRLHFVQNRNLLHSQSVANLILLPARSLPSEAVGADSCPIGDGSDFFEDSDDFAVPPYPQFRCTRCPFASEQRRDFRQHVQCHFARSRLRCPFCDFSTPSSRSLLCHVMLHFNLPGSEMSALAPSYRSLNPWKSVVADILSYLRKFSDNAHERDGVSFADCREAAAADDDAENLTSLDGGRLISADDSVCISSDGVREECQRDDGLQDNSRVMEDPIKQFVRIKSEAVAECPQQDDDDEAAASTLDIHDRDFAKNEELESIVGCSGGSSIDVHGTACQYCDRLLSSLNQLAKHEAGHLIGHPF